MNHTFEEVYKTLHAIYDKHWRKYRENPDSKQMCCMWPTDDPPDVLEDTEPLLDIEEAFDISIDEDAAIELYDMMLDEATKRIMEFMAREKVSQKPEVRREKASLSGTNLCYICDNSLSIDRIQM